MALTPRQLELMYLGGTVSFPSVFPHVGVIEIDESSMPPTLRIEEAQLGRRVARSMLLEDVSAVFIPFDPKKVDLNLGTWFYRQPGTNRDPVTAGDVQGAPQSLNQEEFDLVAGKLGIVYVREDAKVFIETSVEASESENFVTSIIKYLGCN